MKNLLFSLIAIGGSLYAQAQKSEPMIDSAALVKEMGESSCACIDSVSKSGSLAGKPQEELKAIGDCIDKHVTPLQFALGLATINPKDKSKSEIQVDLNKESAGYKKNYYILERWLHSNCAVMGKMVATNDVEREKSFSSKPDAMQAYNKGVRLIQAEKYQQAIPLFEKAVQIDPEFAFAWDNLGVSYRRVSNFEKAEWAYKSSLKVDPEGRTPLMNLPVVYLKQNKNEEAIAAYRRLLEVYEDDPESYYGIALVYIQNKKEYETALPFICKAYNLYVKQKSPYRSDAEKLINAIYAQMKAAGKEEAFWKVLKEHNISSN